ncbi:MAG TPA: septal ring lytic transglycosylase RlpA family protein [Dokdonella sp.]|uniref:septal ring lytic transglycosylase RlpA family protein n=1 Tax=Dokdonella sp. TaxID=2291710 RepID=UPI0025BE0EB0|nr:septal ring lytic transglycosylase RlpA family protein [Dokdonella sp.]MBX3690674.1 septal ring lytic transglycosylase RlpA family protein [Dokdonella sp.]MCW5567751.1 septal ring lytic transglycosylase RlpA family protein [Dokdonella sp.]HNR92058.1 septal ring lytic transglycosylase RlpA family protein [Dokdonella sp.]
MTALRACALALLALTLAACVARKPRPQPPSTSSPATPAAPVHETQLPQSQRYRKTRDSEPDGVRVDIASLVEPVPKPEPRSRYGNKSPYSVLGKSYVVLPDARGYVERGISSWYGAKFHGYMTSSLEPYDMYQFSAAHKSLPLPSWARVTNLENGKSVIVRVNDRGPFHDNRLIDLSYAAAVRIGIWPKGTGLVEVRAIDPAHPEATPLPAPQPVAPGEPHIYLQLGAFAERANAERIERELRAQRFGNVRIVTIDVDGRTIHRVRLGPLADIDAADTTGKRLERLGFGTPRVAIDD